jgi:hypothetical protein
MVDYIINAGTYEDLCDISIIPDEGKLLKYEDLNRNGIIFCKTDYLEYLFTNISQSKKKYVLMTHHSDYPIDSYLFNKKPDCIVKWYAINPIHKNPSLISIPLGLKTHKGIYLEKKYMTEWFVSNLDTLRVNQKKDVVYCNWTNTNQYRNSIIQKLKNNGINYILESNLSFDEYVTNMSKCKWVISPPGNGIDCHRTWEALYLGCIPIVIENYIYEDWNLPILRINDYSDLKPETLLNFDSGLYSLEKLDIRYWKKNILEQL